LALRRSNELILHYVERVRTISELRMLADHLVHPLDVGRDASVEAWIASLSTTTSPAHRTVQHPATVLMADQWTARVALQRIQNHILNFPFNGMARKFSGGERTQGFTGMEVFQLGSDAKSGTSTNEASI